MRPPWRWRSARATISRNWRGGRLPASPKRKKSAAPSCKASWNNWASTNTVHLTDRVWEGLLLGGTRTLVSPSPDFPAFAGGKGIYRQESAMRIYRIYGPFKVRLSASDIQGRYL